MSAAGTAFGLATGCVAALLILVTVIGSAGGINDILDQDQYQDRLDAIAAVYRQGAKAREAMERSGITLPDEATCTDALYRTGADRERSMVASSRRTEDHQIDEAFNELRRLSFVNGCLGRPNNLPSTPLPPPSPTPSAG